MNNTVTVNVNKSNILILSKRRQLVCNFHKIRNEPLEVIKKYKHLGIYFSKNGSFFFSLYTINNFTGNKGNDSLIRNANRLNLPYIQIDLFEKAV